MANFHGNTMPSGGSYSHNDVPIVRATLASAVPVNMGMNVKIENDTRRNSVSSVLTNMHGPSGTRGKDARELDRGE